MTRARLGIALVGATLLGAACNHGCFSTSSFRASGTIAGYALSGVVDSGIARDYLEGRPLPASLSVARRRHLTSGQAPSRDDLAAVARDYSPDVATLLFLEALSASPATRVLRARYEAELAHVRRVGIDNARPEIPDALLVLLVPGWFYVTHGKDTGADLRPQRALLDRLGAAQRLVAVNENGTLEDNARIVADTIRTVSRDHRVLLVSASKGGPEVALALGRELGASETRSVLGWLSIGGIVRGTPFADRVLAPDLCWFTKIKLGLDGFDLDGAKSMQTARARRVFDGLTLPSHIRIVSYVATPLSGHISRRGAFGYGRMRSLGPNDGLTLLVDELIPGGTPLLAPGVDHFFEHEDQELWSAAVFRLLIADVLRKG